MEVFSGYVNNLCTKSCALDQCCVSVLCCVSGCVSGNWSLHGGQLTDKFKVGVITPLLKESRADHENFSNFRPVSNLYFLSQVI